MKKLSKTKLVKEMSRERVGRVPATKRVESKKGYQRKPKYPETDEAQS